METHSRILDWRIPWTEEPGRLQSMRSQKVRQLSTAQHIYSQIDGYIDSLSIDYRFVSIHIYICMKILIIGTGSCDYDLPSTSWRPRRASGVIQSNSKGLRTRHINVQGQRKSTDHFKQREKANSLFFHLSVVFKLSILRMMPTHVVGTSSLSL